MHNYYTAELNETIHLFVGYASEDSDLDSDMSSISGRTDESYRVSDNEEESDAESFFTTDSWHRSREGTPAMMNELRDLRQATPLREMTPGTSVIY